MYLDYAAHTAASSQVLQAYCAAVHQCQGNANSVHQAGREAADILEQATVSVARMLGALPEEVIYTSGATESNNLAIKGLAKSSPVGKHIITTYLEHASVLGPVSALRTQGYELDFVSLDSDGNIDLEELESLLRPDTALFSCCWVDSEVGLIQDIKALSMLLEKYPRCFWHIDATQAVGKIPVTFEPRMDALSFSPHKFYGMEGTGGLLLRKGRLIQPLFHGGASQSPFRSGSPAATLAVATDVALHDAMDHLDANATKMRSLWNTVNDRLKKIPNVSMNSRENGSPYILNFSTDMRGDALQAALDERGICVSSKSACSPANAISKPVLALTGDKKRAHQTLRVSFGWATSDAQIDEFCTVLEELLSAATN